MKLICADTVLTMVPGEKPLENGAVLVDGGRIGDVGARDALVQKYPDVPVEEYEGSVLMPGLVCAYSRPELAAFRKGGRIPSDQIAMDATALDYRRQIAPKDAQDAVLSELGRWMDSGVTCVGAATSFDGMFSATGECGIRAVIMPEVVGGAGDEAQDAFEAALALVDENAKGDLVRPGLAPAAPYLLSKQLLKLVSEHARTFDLPLYIRAASSFAEMEFFFDSQGPIADFLFPQLGWTDLPPAHRLTPIQYLFEIGFMKAKTAIVGGMCLAGKDFSLLARSGSRVVWCPKTHLTLKSGKFPWGKLSEVGVPMAIGIDDWALPESDMWSEMRVALMPDAVEGGPKPHDLLIAATLGGARTLRIDGEVGTLEPGKRADYIIVEKFDGEDVASGLIQNVQTSSVSVVAIDGKVVRKRI